MNQDVRRSRKLFWKEVDKVNGGMGESYSRINNGKGKLVLGEDKKEVLRRIILMIYIMWILKSRVQSTFLALMVFREVITSTDSRLGELSWR